MQQSILAGVTETIQSLQIRRRSQTISTISNTTLTDVPTESNPAKAVKGLEVRFSEDTKNEDNKPSGGGTILNRPMSLGTVPTVPDVAVEDRANVVALPSSISSLNDESSHSDSVVTLPVSDSQTGEYSADQFEAENSTSGLTDT